MVFDLAQSGGLAVMRFLKERGEPSPSLFRVNLEDRPLKLTALDWRPDEFGQAEGRSRRRTMVKAIKRPGHNASRNEREGVYNFKVRGRHTRKRRAPKISIFDSAAIAMAFAAHVEGKNA